MGIKAADFKRMQERLSGKKTSGDVDPQLEAKPLLTADCVLIGIDPSLRGTGYGVVEYAGKRLKALDYGTIKCPTQWEGSRCLAAINTKVRQLVKKYRPEVCAIEGLFYAQNMKTALTMGQARGASLAAVAEQGIRIYEISPRKVKLAIVGYGAAQKEAVAKMVQRMLRLEAMPEPDAADALAVALALTQEQGRWATRSLKQI